MCLLLTERDNNPEDVHCDTLFIYSDQQAKHGCQTFSRQQQSDSIISCILRRHCHFEKGTTRHWADNMDLTVGWKFLEAFLSEMSKQCGGRRIHWCTAPSVGHVFFLVVWKKNPHYLSLLVKSAAFSTFSTYRCPNTSFFLTLGFQKYHSACVPSHSTAAAVVKCRQTLISWWLIVCVWKPWWWRAPDIVLWLWLKPADPPLKRC